MLTVLLATKNRATLLRQVLESFCQLHPPTGGWKLVVVDNGSTDGTPRMLDSFSSRLPLKFLVEPAPGKNSALNAGLALAEGDLYVFTDDDVFPNPDWLVQLRLAADQNPTYSMFGGAILPRWEIPPPEWVHWLDLGPIFTLTDSWLTERPLSIDGISVIQGPNMAVRAQVFQSGIRFDSSIGPRGTDYAMGSETELLSRLSRAGQKGWHAPAAVVQHYVRKEQLSQDWVLRRAIRLGRGRQRMATHPKLWFGVPRHLFRDIPKESLSVLGAALTMRKAALLRARWRLNILRGKWIEARTLSSERNAPACEVQSNNAMKHAE